ncbi:auxin response factor 8-like [Castanea sativa]|uniref:auxin response factor 8-like n=1 Tax=Castanea sativa TaxID=21020 RepID=UPI003F64E5DE
MPQHLIQQSLNNQQEDQAWQQQHTYQNALHIRSDQLHQRLQSNVHSSSFVKAGFMDPSTKFSKFISPRQNMVSSLCPEGSSNILNFSRVGQSMLAEQLPQRSWAPKYSHSQVDAFANSMSHSPYPGKDATEEPEIFDADVSSMPLGDTGFQNSLYSSVQVSSELLNSAGQVDPPTPSQTFVKVYKSGSVGCSLDISQFSSYNELQEKLAQMFGIEGKFEDPLRLG